MLSWELKLEKRIRDAGYKCSAFDGVTSHDDRKAYFRSIITMHGLGDKACGQTTFAQAFTTVFREKL